LSCENDATVLKYFPQAIFILYGPAVSVKLTKMI